MLGVLPVNSTNLNLQLPTPLLTALDRYRATLIPRPTRSFLIRQFIAECLHARHVEIPLPEEPETPPEG
jgi:hypothetical protein